MDQNLEPIIVSYFTDFLGFPPKITISSSTDEISINLELDGSSSGMVIGYRGEVLSSLQLILALIIQKHLQVWTPVRINVNDYREQRQKSLENLAASAASKAISFNRPVTLSNLSSYERRLIHSFLSNDPSVSTHSEGEGKSRILVVSPSS